MPRTINSVLIKTAATNPATHPPLARITHHPVLDQDGTRFWIDGAHPGCVPAAGDPPNGQYLTDLSISATQPQWLVGAGNPVAYSGNGWDFAGVTAPFVSGLVLPAAPMADIWGNGAVAQYWGVVLYVRLQSVAAWHSLPEVLPYVHHNGGGTDYTTPGLATIGSRTVGGDRQIAFLRGVGGGVVNISALTMPAASGGKFAQLAIWRDAEGLHHRVMYDDGADGVPVGPAVVTGLGNSAYNFSAQTGRLGVFPLYATLEASATAWKLYAYGIENLRTSGRDFAAVLDDDWRWRLRLKRAGVYA